MWAFFAVGLALVASGPGLAIVLLRRLWLRDDFLLLRTDDPTGLWFRASWHLRRSSERQSAGAPGDDTDLTAALRMIDRGLARRERSYILQMHRATTLGRLGRAREALEATERALQINPAHHFGWYTRGALEERLRRYDAAVNTLQRSG